MRLKLALLLLGAALLPFLPAQVLLLLFYLGLLGWSVRWLLRHLARDLARWGVL